MNEYYKILGLMPGATQVEIKRAYRRMALKFHPDRNKNPGAREQFIRIAKAYEILSNPPKVTPPREVYKRTNHAAEERKRRETEMKKREFRRRYAAHKRKKELEQNQAYSQGITIIISIVFIVLASVFAENFYHDYKVSQNTQETIGKVVNYERHRFFVQYQANGKNYVESFSGDRSRNILCTPNGMPVVIGAEFIVKFNNEEPEWCRLDDESITSKTLQLYVNAIRYNVKDQFQIEENDPRIRCMALQTFNKFGIDGLSNFYFWDESFLENMSNNSNTFQTMVESPAFQQIIIDCLLAEDSPAK